jgi:hypothetical protein
MECECSKNEIVKEQIFKEEANTNRSINSRNSKNIINNNNYSISENSLDSNLNKHFNSFQNSNCLTYQLFEYINKIRMNPISIIEKIEMFKEKIIEKDNKILFDCGNNVYSLLNKGKKAFDDCIKFLSVQIALEPLELNNDLKIDINIEKEEKKDYYYSFEYIEKMLNKKYEQIKNEYNILGFHYDICSNNTEISSILQLVDDDIENNLTRRKNILNRNVKYVGISYVNIKENIICYYLLFGNKKKI